MKLKIVTIVIIMFLVGLGIHYIFKWGKIPEQSNFYLSESVSKKVGKVGEEIEVQAELQNLSNSSYKVSHGPNLIDIFNEINLRQPILKYTEFKKDSTVISKRTFMFPSKGIYEIQVQSEFSITNPYTKKKRDYLIKNEPIIIEIK